MEKAKDHKSGSIVPVLACVLNQLCVSNDQMPFSPKESNSKFHALRIPFINLRDYLERIAKYSGCSSECLVLALVYIDRIIQGSQSFIVNSYCIHRLLITSVMLAAKFFDDHYYNNAYYAKVGGVTYSEMNALEVEFLFMLNFDLFVTTETYKQYYDELWSHANSTPAHLCGCINAKVPLLILPRFDEVRKTPPTMLTDDSDSVDQSDLDLIDDDSPSPTLEIPTLSAHCGTKIHPVEAVITATTSTQPPTSLKPVLLPEQQTTSRAISSAIPIPKRISPDLSDPAMWHVSPSTSVKHDRIIAPPLCNKPVGLPSQELKNPAFSSGTNPFLFPEPQKLQQLQPPQPLAPQLTVVYEETPNLFSSNSKFSVQANQIATPPARDEVMLDIVDHSMGPRASTPTLGGQAGGRHLSSGQHVSSAQVDMTESPSLTAKPTTSLGSGVGFYGDFPSFLSSTDALDEENEGEEDETIMMDSKLYDVSPTFHPYGIGQQFIPSVSSSSHRGFEDSHRSHPVWTAGYPSNRFPTYPSHQAVGRLNSHTGSKRKNSNNTRGDSNLWQSIVLPVY